MFKSKIRPVVYSQYEHGRLAGTLARNWGNDQFERPPFDFDAFADGITLHDWGYGVLDNVPIGEASEEAWLEVVRQGLNTRFTHPVTDIVAKLHIRRLLSWDPSPVRERFINEIDEHVESRLRNAGIKRVSKGVLELKDFQRVDKITQLCDTISFDFCFEKPRKRALSVFAGQDSTVLSEIHYEIRPGGEVRVDPWPFTVTDISGILYAFLRERYPQKLDPIIVPFNIRPGSRG